MPWLRLWVDILDDPDMCALSDETFGGWCKMLAVAKRNDPQGQLPQLKRLAHILHRDEATVSRWINELMDAGLVDEIGGSLWMHNWQHWQQKNDRTNAKRQADWRRRNAPPDTPPEEKRGEERGNVTALRNDVTLSNGVTVPLPPPPPVTRHPDSDRVCNLAAEIGGDIGWATWAENRLRMGDTPKAIECALNEAVNANVISTAYVGKVLGRYAREGVPSGKPRPGGRPQVKDRGPENQPARPDPDVMARIEEELSKRPKMSPKDFEGGGRRVGA